MTRAAAAVAIAAIVLVMLIAFATRPPESVVISSFATSLEGRSGSQIHNARIAAKKIDGATIEPGQMFSFNDCVGSWSAYDGYQRAPVSFGGQMISTWGGGVCQTSTTLYNAALLAGLDIVERHPHRFAPTYAPAGRDAAVAFQSLDLVIRNPHSSAIELRARVHRGQVVVECYAQGEIEERFEIVQRDLRIVPPQMARVEEQSPTRLILHKGAPAVSVSVYRIARSSHGERSELISADSYPAASRIEVRATSE